MTNSGTNCLKYAPVTIVMGSQSDWETMREAEAVLKKVGIEYCAQVVSAHRTPKRLVEFAESAEQNGVKVVIAGAGGAAHLPGMLASEMTIPVIGVPVQSKALNGMDSLLSIVQMPRGIPVATQAIGGAGAYNAGVYAAQIMSLLDADLATKFAEWRQELTASVPFEVS